MATTADLQHRIEEILQKAFPGETVDVSEGYRDNIHVVVVSKAFTDMSEREKQDRLWQCIDDSDLTDREKAQISLIVPYSPRELK